MEEESKAYYPRSQLPPALSTVARLFLRCLFSFPSVIYQQKIVSGGHTADLPYEFLLPCMCIEVSTGKCGLVMAPHPTASPVSQLTKE